MTVYKDRAFRISAAFRMFVKLVNVASMDSRNLLRCASTWLLQ